MSEYWRHVKGKRIEVLLDIGQRALLLSKCILDELIYTSSSGMMPHPSHYFLLIIDALCHSQGPFSSSCASVEGHLIISNAEPMCKKSLQASLELQFTPARRLFERYPTPMLVSAVLLHARLTQFHGVHTLQTRQSPWQD